MVPFLLDNQCKLHLIILSVNDFTTLRDFIEFCCDFSKNTLILQSLSIYIKILIIWKIILAKYKEINPISERIIPCKYIIIYP